jgi:hypothetical protein
MRILSEIVETTLSINSAAPLIESLEASAPSLKREFVSIGSALSGASLAAVWASFGVAASTATIKGLLLAAGFSNPVTLTTVATIAAGAIAAATIAAGGRIAYNISKDVSRGVYNPTSSQRIASDLLDEVVKRDIALREKNEKAIVKYTASMQRTAKELHNAASSDLKKGDIDRKTFHAYIRLSEKGVLGRLSTLV